MCVAEVPPLCAVRTRPDTRGSPAETVDRSVASQPPCVTMRAAASTCFGVVAACPQLAHTPSCRVPSPQCTVPRGPSPIADGAAVTSSFASQTMPGVRQGRPPCRAHAAGGVGAAAGEQQGQRLHWNQPLRRRHGLHQGPAGQRPGQCDLPHLWPRRRGVPPAIH